MKRNKLIMKLIGVVVCITVLFTNCVWAGELAVSHKMAAHSQLKEIEPVAAVQYVNQAVLDTLIRNSATTNNDIREKSGDIDRELKEAVKGINEGKFLYGVLRNREKPGECALYVVYPYLAKSGKVVVHRYSKQGEPEDPLYSKFLKGHVKQSEPIQSGDQTFNHEIILVPPELNEYILSLQFPGESPRGLAKSLSFDNGPVTQEERDDVERLIANYESRGEVTLLTSEEVGRVGDAILRQEYSSLIGKIEFKSVPDMVVRIGNRARVFPAYTKRVDTPEGPKWITYISRSFASKMISYHATSVIEMLFCHEFTEIITENHNEAERKELTSHAITIAGQSMSYLDAFIYYYYAEELGCMSAPWWQELQRWIILEKLRLIISTTGNDKATDLRGMKEEIFSLGEKFSKLEEIKIDWQAGGINNLWEYTIDVCKSLQEFLEVNREYYNSEVGKRNFSRFSQYAESITNHSDIRELLWLTTIFFQIGKTEDRGLGNYYLKGKEMFKRLLSEYYKNAGKTPKDIERLVKLGSELIYRFGDIRALYMGHITPEILLRIKDIEELSVEDKELLLKLINVFTFIYPHHYKFRALDDAVVNFILDKTSTLERIEQLAKETEWDEKRLDTWFSPEYKAKFWAVFFDIVPEMEQNSLRKFIKKINLFNTFRTFNSLYNKMLTAENKKFYAETLVKMFYFFMKLNKYTQKDWINFAQDRNISEDIAEDMINKFGYTTIEEIDGVFEKEGESYIKPNFESGKRVIIFGIPFYIDGNRIIMDLHRYGAKVEHGINIEERQLAEAVRDPSESLKGRYYDLLIVVTDESSTPEMDRLVVSAREGGYIPQRAKVLVVSQPKGMIKGNWSAIINLMCNSELQVDGVQLGEYIKDKNVAVVLSAGTAKRNAPMTSFGYMDKGKMTGYNGNPYLFQTFKQIMCYFEPERKGMVITTNDGIKCISEQVALGKQGFQIIGAAKPALIGPDREYDPNGEFNSTELGELGCMQVDLLGNILEFVEKPKNREELGDAPFVPTNWADYFLRLDFLLALVDVYGDLRDKDGKLLYLKYGLDTSEDFSEPCTLDKKDYIAKKVKEKWAPEDAGKIWNAAQELKRKFHIGFVNAGRDAFFKDTGTNQTFKDLARDLLKDDERARNLRRHLGMTGYRIIMGNLFGPNVRLGKDVKLGKGIVLVGSVTIQEGVIGDDCVIIDSIVKGVNLASRTVLYGVYRPQGEISLTKPDRLVTDIFLDIDSMTDKRRKELRLDVIEFPNGKKTTRMPIVLPVESKANDEIYEYKVKDQAGHEFIVYTRNDEIVNDDVPGYNKGTKDIKEDTGTNELVYISKDGQRKVIGKIIKKRGDIVWKLSIWPRLDTQSDWDGQPRIEQMDSSVAKMSFAEIADDMDKDALRAFKELLANPYIVLPITRLRHECFGVVESITSEIIDDFNSRVSLLNMNPVSGKEVEVNAGSNPFEVTVEAELDSVQPRYVSVEIWYGPQNSPSEWQAIAMKSCELIGDGRYRYKGGIPIPSTIEGDKGFLGFTCRVRLLNTELTKWASKRIGDDGFILIRQPAIVAGPIARKVRADEGVPLWQADLKEDGQIDETKVTVIIPAHTKISKLDLDKYGKVRERLIKRYGLGIYGAVSGVRVVDNLVMGEGEDVAPYAVVREIDGRKYILIDIDAFSLEVEQLYIVIEHSLKHSILELITDNKVLEELTAIYMSLEEAMEMGVSAPSNLDELGMDSRFWELLSGLKKVEAEKRTPAVIISYAIECLRRIPYYREIFNRLGLDEAQWIKAVRQAEQKTLAAIDVYTQLTGNDRTELVEGVRKIKGQEKETRARLTNIAGIQVPESIAKAAKKIKMLSSSIPVRQMGFVDRLFSKGKYIRLYVEDLRTNPYIVEWLQDLLKGKDKSPFIICSREEEPEKAQSVIDQFLSKNKLIQAQAPAGIDTKDIIDTSDLSCVLGKELPKNCLSLPLIFSVSSIYLAGEVVLADGSIDQLKERDPLVYNTLMAVYATLFGDDFTSDMLKQIIFGEWPEASDVTENVETLRIAIAEIEKAA